MAFRASSLSRIGGFDIALGPGTASMSNEDTRVFTDLLCSGGTVVYQPTAVTRHFHRRSVEELRTQMLGYGVGLTAFYASLVLRIAPVLPGLHPARAQGVPGYVRPRGPAEQRAPPGFPGGPAERPSGAVCSSVRCRTSAPGWRRLGQSEKPKGCDDGERGVGRTRGRRGASRVQHGAGQ